ncbi:hypothetical protein [Solemya velesiana gill symbiont]
MPWLYLGYWLSCNRKMDYKTQYRPIQLLRGGQWHRYAPGETLFEPPNR